MTRRCVEPFIQFGKLTVIEVSPGDVNAIGVAVSLVEGLVGQRAPKVDVSKIAIYRDVYK